MMKGCERWHRGDPILIVKILSPETDVCDALNTRLQMTKGED